MAKATGALNKVNVSRKETKKNPGNSETDLQNNVHPQGPQTVHFVCYTQDILTNVTKAWSGMNTVFDEILHFFHFVLIKAAEHFKLKQFI